MIQKGAELSVRSSDPAVTGPDQIAALQGLLPELWKDCVGSLGDEEGAERLPDWFRQNLQSARISINSDGQLVVQIGSDLTREWLERRFRTRLEFRIQERIGIALPIRVEAGPAPASNGRGRVSSRSTAAGAGDEKPAARKTRSAQPRKPQLEVLRPQLEAQLNCLPLNSRYRFDTFVVGEGNRFAQAAAAAVSAGPANTYNPLFIHSSVGLGKTHLMHAIGHEIQENRPDAVVAYLSGEAFTTSFVGALRERRMDEFRKLYRHVDVWLVDDIQFIASKERTGEEFFHTFTSLYETDRQVVICSDRPPQELKILDERMVSRFSAGLVADISAPDYETRLAILQQQLGEGMGEVPSEVLEMIARMVRSNVRVLEGALIRLLAHASFTGNKISLQMATPLLSRFFDDGAHSRIRVETVQRVVCQSLEVSEEVLAGKKRDRRSLLARQMAMFLSREMTDSSLSQIGDLFGGKDHSTVAHACRSFRESLRQDSELERRVGMVRERIRRQK